MPAEQNGTNPGETVVMIDSGGENTLDREAALRLFHLLGLPPISGGDGTGDDDGEPDDSGDDDSDGDDDDDDLNETDLERVKAALKKERKTRRDAEKTARGLAKEKADREKADKDAADAEALKTGDVRKLAEERQKTIDELTKDRDARLKERDDARKLLQPVVDADWKALPKEIADAYRGDKDDLHAKAQFIQDMKAAADALRNVKKGGNPGRPGAGDDKSKGGDDDKSSEELPAELSLARLSG